VPLGREGLRKVASQASRGTFTDSFIARPAANSKPYNSVFRCFGLKVPCSGKGRPVEHFESAGGKTRSVDEARDNSGFGSEDAYSD
jgi:hypothetical protein